MNCTEAFDLLRLAGSDGEDAYITMMCAIEFGSGTTDNGSRVRCTTPGSFDVETFNDIIPV